MGLGITKVEIKNLTPNAISAVRLNWILFEGQGRDDILRQGRTPLIAISEGLPSGQKQVLEYSVVSFVKLAKRLLKDGRLYGQFRIEVKVAEVVYEDGTLSEVTQRIDDPNVNAIASPSPVPSCPQQGCGLAHPPSGSDYYTCVNTTGEMQWCENHVTSCTNHLCEKISSSD
jgi:hypothetical protein